ncbi:MAG: hypothetical protein IKM66_06420 [Clostridia bacterium]|nr:hypothetical protein [Clostridia bacterium]
MKIAKKTLSIFLSLLMIFGACSAGLTGMTITAAAATGTVQSVKNALTDYVVNEIVYHGHLEHNSYTYKGDAAVAAAADEIYAYAMSLRQGNSSTSQVNSTAGVLNAVANNTGFTSGDKYKALQYILDPAGDVISAIELVTPKYGGECDGCDHKYVYNTIPTNVGVKKTVKVYGTVNSLLEKYGSVDEIPASLLQGVSFEYSLVVDQACLDQNEHKSGCDTVYDCYGYRWNYFGSIKRTEIKNIVSIDELKEFGKTLASVDLSMTFDEMIALDAAELQAIYDENYGPYQAMIDKYSFDVIKDLYGSYNAYFADLLKAMQINLSLPAIDILKNYVGTAYDSSNYNEMAAIYAPANSAYNAIKGYGSEVFDYIATKAEYADFNIAAARDYLNDMKKAMDLITLPGLKATIDADLAAYNGVNLNTLEIPVLKTLLNKLNGYKGTINAANGTAVSAVMGSTVNNLNNLINSVKANIEARSPAETEAAFNVQYNYYTPILFGNYGAMATADVMTMFSDFDVNLEALKVVYDEQVAKYGASVVNPLFSVTIGEGGTPALIQNVVSKSSIQTELVARNSAQLAIAAGYKDMAANVNFDNLVTISTAIKTFDQALYQLCADNGLVSAADQALYADVQTVINAFNAFINKINSEGFQKVELDENGVYVVRDVYDEDLVKEEAYTVDEDKLNATIVKLDNFLASEDFGALLGFEDADGNAVGLGDYLYGMIGEMLFNDDLINMVVGMLFPMIEDLLVNEIGALLAGETVNPNGVPPQNPGSLGYVDLASLVDAVSGGIDIYIGDVTKEGQQRIQQDFPTLLAGAGLYAYPTTLADSLVTSGVLTTSSETYKKLKEAGKTWTSLGVFDPETETFTYALDLDWGITDRASFTKVLGGVLDSVGSLLPTLFLNTAFDKKLGSAESPAGVGYGSISAAGILNANNAEFYATLSLTVQPLNLYANLFQPLFGLLGVTANANLTASSKGIDYAKAILDPIFGLLDKVVAAPLDTILGLLPSLAYILSTDFIDSFLGSIVLDFSVKLGIAGTNADGLAGGAINTLASLLTFEVFGDQMGIADIAGAATLKDLVGIDISNINSLLDFLFETLEVNLDLPDIDQTGLIECAKWNSKSSLTADKADVLFFLLDYLVSALNPDFLNTILGLLGGDIDLSGTIGTVLNNVLAAVGNNPDGAIAALVELLNPVEYELKEMTWAEGMDESIVYLHYANDWTKSESQYLIDNALNLVATVLGMTGSEVTDVNAFLNEKVNGLFADLFTNETITKLVETFAGIELPEILNDILVDQLGVNMGAWANDFGYLFNEELTAPEASVLGVTVTEDAEGNYVWNGLVDGDKEVFVDTLCAVLAPLAPAVAFLLGGKDLGVFGIVELKGYESFDSTLGLLLETLGITVPAVDFAADPMTALNSVVDAVFTWLDATLASDDLVEVAVNLVADLLYYIESNGLSVLLHNLLLPVLALVDTVRPIVNVDVNTIVSVIVSDLINGNGLALGKIVDLVFGEFEGNDDLLVTITIDNLTLTDVLAIVDVVFGSDLEHSTLATIGLKGLCNADVDAADALTIILSALIDCLDEPAADTSMTNAQALFGFIEEKTGNDQITEIVTTVLDLIGGIVYEYSAPDWGYMMGLDEEFNVILPERSIVYLGYQNNWTEETADAVYDSLDEIVGMVLDSLVGSDIATLLNGLLEDNVYSDEILNTVVELLVNLLADLDASLFEIVDVVVDTDISTWFTFCTLNEETGEYECTKDWGVDAATDKKATFVAAIKEVLAPANRLLAWLFFGDSYEFFTDSEKDAEGNYTYKSLITLNGGEGYAKGLVPILEALGCEMKAADAYLVNGEYDATAAVEDIFNALLALVDKVSANPVEEAFKLIPNIIYFLNAGGIKSSVNNLLAPVNAIIEKLSPIVGDVSIGGLLAEQIGFDITDITTDSLLALAADAGFVMSDKHVELLKTFYIGEIVKYESANGDYAYRMAYTDEESASDMLTIVLSLVIDLFKLNKELFEGLLGEDIVNAIMSILELEGAKAMQDFSWLYTEYADTDKIFTPVETTEKYTATYNEYWTKDKAQTLVDRADDFVLNILHVLNLEIDGVKMSDVETIINSLISDLYSQANADAILTMVKDLVAQLSDLEPYGDLIKTVAKSALGVDLTAWDNMVVTVEDGNRDSFSKAIGQILAPVVPVLEILLTSKDVSFFVDIEGVNAITLYGSEGYAYGIIPLLEALGCEGVLTPDEYKAAVAADPAAAITSIINPLFDKIDEIAADPINEVLELLPAVIYFVNSNGLDTVVKNVLNSVDTVLAGLEPLVGVTSIVDLLGIDLATYNFDYLFNMLLDMAADTGFELEEIAGNAINELTIGRVVSYQSKNGETYYTMQYASDRDMADMVTVLLRLIVDFVTMEENLAVFKDMLADVITDEDTYKSVCSILDSVAAAVNEDPNLGKGMAVVYYFFVTLDNVAEGADDIYHDVTNSWEFILKQLETSNDPILRNLEKSLKNALNKYFGTDYEVGDSEDIIDEEKDTGIAAFFKAIADFFKKIGDFFRKLFGMA